MIAAFSSTAARALFRRWTLWTWLGEAAGFAIPAVVGAIAISADTSGAGALPLAALAGAGEGAILGLAQAHVLARELVGFERRAWVVATACAAAFAWSVGMAVGSSAGDLPVAVAAVLGGGAAVAILASVGTAQWLVLRRIVARAGLWIPANAVAWALGGAFTILLSALGDGAPAGAYAAAGVLAGAAMALVVAAVTGLALVRLLHERSNTRLTLATSLMASVQLRGRTAVHE